MFLAHVINKISCKVSHMLALLTFELTPEMYTLFVIYHPGTISLIVGGIFQITEWTFYSPLVLFGTFLIMSNEGVASYRGLAERAFDKIFVFMVRLLHVLHEVFGQFTPEIKDNWFRVL